MDGVINSITLYTVESGMITGYVQVWPTSGNGGHLRHWHRIAAAVSLIAVRYSRSILFHVCSDMSPRSGSRCLTIWFGWQFTLQSASVSWLSYNDDTSTDVSSSFSLRQCLARDVSLLSLRSTCAKWWLYFIIDSMLAECYVAALKDLLISLNAHCLSCFPTMGPTWTHEGHSPYVYLLFHLLSIMVSLPIHVSDHPSTSLQSRGDTIGVSSKVRIAILEPLHCV